MTNPASNTIHSNVVPSEVGWQFVPQYYTFVNKQPDYLHRFYTKKSTFIHGTEGEDGKPCHGQQEIHAKITSLQFQDCKVFIHSVDAQSSADGGIIIQVIGEMSNRGEDWRKFVQTFFLAEQPNGYFVLNDIFRFLKEETVDSDDVRDSDEPVTTAEPVPPPVVATTATEIAQEPPIAPAPVVSMSASPAPPPAPVEEPPAPVPEVPEEVPEPPAEPEPEAPPPAAVPVPPKTNGHVQEPEKQAQPTPAAPPPVTEKARSPAPPPAAAPPPQPPAAAAPPAPAAPKTWANLAAANSKKWGSAVSSESKGTTEVIPPSPAGSGTQTPSNAGSSAPGPNAKGQHPAVLAAQSISTAHVFIKGVTEAVSQTILSNYLTQNFGPLKELDIIRPKFCAFGEFQTLDAAKRAIITCLPQSQGGQGGIWLEVPGGESVRIVVDTRKERNDRPAPRPRGGAPQGGGGEGRGGGMQGGNVGGSFRGRGGGRGRGAGPK